MNAPLALVLDLLGWVAARPRTYAETMDAWRTSCPRLPVWEDATENGFVIVESAGAGFRGQGVRLTETGRLFLAEHRR